MQMGVVLPVCSAHRRDLLAARDACAAAHQHRVEVAVKGVDVADVAILPIGVPDDYHIPPAQMNVPGKNHDAVADAVDRVPQIGVAASNPVPIFTQMPTGPKSAGL